MNKRIIYLSVVSVVVFLILVLAANNLIKKYAAEPIALEQAYPAAKLEVKPKELKPSAQEAPEAAQQEAALPSGEPLLN